MMATDGSQENVDDLFAPKSADEMARRLGADLGEMEKAVSSAGLDPALEAELQDMLSRAMNIDSFNDGVTCGTVGKTSIASVPEDTKSGDILAALSEDLDEYEAVDRDLDVISSALSQIEAQSNDLKSMVSELFVSQELARSQHLLYPSANTASYESNSNESIDEASSDHSTDIEVDGVGNL